MAHNRTRDALSDTESGRWSPNATAQLVATPAATL